MPIGLLGRKLGMSQIFDQHGRLVPVTFIEAGPCVVLDKKTVEEDGYNAVQLGFGQRKEKNTPRPLLGQFKKIGVPPMRFIKEFRLEDTGLLEKLPEVGGVLKISDIFQEGEHVDVVGISKGRGFASPIKRWHTRRGPETHGSMYHRRPGSQGASSYPSRTWKGKHAAGHMGAARCTALNLVIMRTDEEKNLILVRGSVPGHNNGFVIIRKTVRAKKAERQIRLLATKEARLAEIAAKAINPLKASKKAAGR
ncbi:MAG: 50S ribosomal protein L3 [Candidatus Sumerlaeaceae bacterium]|nr:50S ribosomal protein L3 [Candidatus Sumerlaeaceae bacterium]